MADAKPGVWKPRWRTEGARPTVTFYSAHEISKALNCQTSHTFVRSSTPSPDDATGQVVAVFNHLKANPSAPRELWTRNSFDLVQRSVGVPLPMFSESPAKPNRYELTGWYAIESVEIVQGRSPQVKAFIEKREESKGKKSAESWASALREDWAKVTMQKVDDRGDPVKDKLAPPATVESRDPVKDEVAEPATGISS